MQLAFHEDCLGHDPGPRHPESPERIHTIRRRLPEDGITTVEPEPLDRDALTTVHDEAYVEDLHSFCADGGGVWDVDTTASAGSWAAILASAGAACWAAETALEGTTREETPFSLGRPPGHHAVADDAMGFCFVNNVAVAAQRAIEAGDARRVAVLDWDVHHGNGTESIFLERDDVLVASIHEQGIYPGTGAIEQTGVGAGEGATVNVPMPALADDVDYLAAVDRVIEPVVVDFDPDLLLVSAGFDGHRHDPISRIRLSTEGYAHLTDRACAIGEAVEAPLAFVLEGGYALDVLAECVAMVVETVGGREPAEPSAAADGVSDAVEAVIDEAVSVHGIER